MKLARSLSALALVAVFAAQVLAQDQMAALTALIAKAKDAANPTMTFMRGLAELPDFDLDSAKIQRALEAAGVPTNGQIRELLGSTKRFIKKDDRIAIVRNEGSVVELPGGKKLKLGRVIEARVRLSGPNEGVIDMIRGIQSSHWMGWADITSVQFYKDSQRGSMARVNGNVGGFSGHEDFELEPRRRRTSDASGSQQLPDPTGRGFTSQLPPRRA